MLVIVSIILGLFILSTILTLISALMDLNDQIFEERWLKIIRIEIENCRSAKIILHQRGAGGGSNINQFKSEEPEEDIWKGRKMYYANGFGPCPITM